MAERTIELGGLRIHLNADEDAVSMVQALMRYLSNQEVADVLGISERTVRRWIKQGALIAHRFGHQWRVSEPDLALFLRERRGLNL